MTTRLIVNADDYGHTLDVSRGIRAAHLKGIVTSTTAMMNKPAAEESLRQAPGGAPRLGLGVHLTITSGGSLLPAEQIKTLISEDGLFFKVVPFANRLDQVDPAEAKAEWRAQIEQFISVAGRKPTHLDSHHHSSYFSPGLLRAMLELAREYNSPIRLPIAPNANWMLSGMPTEMAAAMQAHIPPLLEEFQPRRPDGFIDNFYDEDATQENLLSILAGLPDGTFELMCHPGCLSPELIANSIYNAQRERELNILTSPEVLQLVRERGIELISFSQI